MNAIEVTHFTKRLVLEPLNAQHANKLFQGFSAPELYKFLPNTPPTSLEELEKRFQKLEGRVSPDGQCLWLNWACRLMASDIYIGLIEVTLNKADRFALLAYFVFCDHQKSGYATEACQTVLEHIFKDYELVASQAEIDDLNEASIALVTKLGFTKVGDSRTIEPFNGKIRSEGTYHMSRETWSQRAS